MGSMKWPLTRLDIYGSLKTDGQSCIGTRNQNGTSMGGMGGGSGGTVLLFLQHLTLGEKSSLSLSGGHGCLLGGGGGGGGRVHFEWSKIAVGDEYVQIASVNGTIDVGYATGVSFKWLDIFLVCYWYLIPVVSGTEEALGVTMEMMEREEQ